jgi:hypothetical protein
MEISGLFVNYHHVIKMYNDLSIYYPRQVGLQVFEPAKNAMCVCVFIFHS